MGLDMFGNDSFSMSNSTDWISMRSNGPMNYVFPNNYTPKTAPIDPRQRRWYFARDTLVKWYQVFYYFTNECTIIFIKSNSWEI